MLAAVPANGVELSLDLLASGRTAMAEGSQLDDVCDHWANHSDHSWKTSEIFQGYLIHLREHFGDQARHLILDKHTSHRTADVRTLAESLNFMVYSTPFLKHVQRYSPDAKFARLELQQFLCFLDLRIGQPYKLNSTY